MIYDKASLVQIPSGYKSGTLYSVVPNTADGDFTVTGDPEGEATRVNKDGLIESVAADVSRLDYPLLDGVVQDCPTLLLEPESANLLQRSEDYANAYWLKARVGSSATGFTAPDGSSNATYFEQQSGQTTAAVIYKSSFTSVSSGVYTFSIWAKQEDKRYIKLQTRVNSATYRTVFDLQDGVITYDSGNENAKIEAYPNGWYRLSVQRTSTTTDDIIVYYYLNDSAGVSDTVTDSGGVYIWGSQVEKKDYLTSYIPTIGSAVTRTADTCVDAGNNTIISSLDGSVFVDLKVTNDSNLKQINLFDGGNNRITISVQFSILSISIVSNVGGTIQTLYSWDVDINTNDRHKIVIRYKENDSKLYYNGLLQTPTTYTGSWFNDGVLDNFSFDKSGAFSFYGKIYQAMIFNEALSDIELETLTSYTSFNQMAKALLYTIE